MDRDLIAMYGESVRVLEDCGYSVGPVTDVALNKRFTSALGKYYYETKKIAINERHFLRSPYDEVINTIVHEIIHHIAQSECPDFIPSERLSHEGRWKEIADDVSRKTKYRITRFSEADEFLLPAVRYEHRMICPKCRNHETVFSKHEYLRRKKFCPCCEYNDLEKVAMQLESMKKYRTFV